jgi:hypothetical protein
MDTSKAGPMTSLSGRTEAIRKRIQQELLSPENPSRARPFIMHYVRRWGIAQDDEDVNKPKTVHSFPWHDWYDSDKP